MSSEVGKTIEILGAPEWAATNKKGDPSEKNLFTGLSLNLCAHDGLHSCRRCVAAHQVGRLLLRHTRGQRVAARGNEQRVQDGPRDGDDGDTGPHVSRTGAAVVC